MFLVINEPGVSVVLLVPMVGFLIPLALFATAALNVINRNNAAATLAEPMVTEAQTIGGTVQDFANRGMMIDRNSPIVKEALRQRSLGQRKQEAAATMGGPSWGDMLGFFFK